EREPFSARPLREDPSMDEPLDLLREPFLVDPHGPEKEGEVELRADGARVGEDAVLFGRERLERRIRAAGRRTLSCRSVRHRLRDNRRTELNTCLGTPPDRRRSRGAT